MPRDLSPPFCLWVVAESIPPALRPYPHKDSIVRKRKREVAGTTRNGKTLQEKNKNVVRESSRRRGGRKCHLFRALSTAVAQWYRFHAPPEEMRQTKVQNKEKGNEKKERGHHQEQARHPLQSKTSTTAFVRTRNKKRKNNPKHYKITFEATAAVCGTSSISLIDRFYPLVALVPCNSVCHHLPAFINRGFPTTVAPPLPIPLDATRDGCASYSISPHPRNHH